MKTIAWDVDDVLNDLMGRWLAEEWAKDHATCPAYADIRENPPHRILGVDLSEYLASLDAYRLSQQYLQLAPMREVLKWFERNGGRFRHIAVTATPIIAAPRSAQWVLDKFGRWVRTFHVVPSPRWDVPMPEYDRRKADFLAWLGKVDVLIDDSEQNITEAEQAGVQGILFPRPWNSSRATVEETLSLL